MKLDRSVIHLLRMQTFVGVSHHLFLSCVAVGESGMPGCKTVVPCLEFMRNGPSFFLIRYI